jgi:hypothetical protein
MVVADPEASEGKTDAVCSSDDLPEACLEARANGQTSSTVSFASNLEAR